MVGDTCTCEGCVVQTVLVDPLVTIGEYECTGESDVCLNACGDDNCFTSPAAGGASCTGFFTYSREIQTSAHELRRPSGAEAGWVSY